MDRMLCRCCAAAVLAAFAAGAAQAGDLVLKRVMLSSGGVGYFEYQAEVTGDATLSLDVKLDQIDDVLKSLVLYDESGSAGAATLPGREPLAQSFVDLPFDRSALDSPAALLNALQGAELRVPGPKPMTGRLVQVVAETARGADGLAVTHNRVTLLTESGLEQFILEDADSIAFVDPELQKKIGAALTRLETYRSDGRRRISLEARGSGKRIVRVGYVVGVPLWKASYRMSLSADPQANRSRLQGWAVLENFSGQAWRDVELTLLSGNPVTFRQALFESYYVERPLVPVEVAGRVLPKPDTGAIAAGFAQEHSALPKAPASAMAARDRAAPVPAPPPPEPARIAAAEAAEGTTQIAFTLPYKVSVAAGQSLVLPILDRELPSHRRDLYQPSADQRHPLAAIELANAGETGLPPGVLTLYEQTGGGAAVYLGDARLAAFPPGEKRMVSYAVDGKVTVDRSSDEERAIVKAAIAQGVMRLTRLVRQTTTYRVKAGEGPERRLVIEHPRLAGWALAVPGSNSVELGADAYRIAVTINGGSEKAVAVTMERPIEETIRLVDLADDRLGVFAASKEIEPSIRNALGGLATRRQALGRLGAELDRLKEQRAQLVADEQRLRDNLAALARDTALHKRTLDKLGEAETAIESVSSGLAKTTAELAAGTQELQSYIAALTL